MGNEIHGLDFELFNTMSATGKKYTGRKVYLRYWNSCNTSNINKGLLHYLAKEGNEEKWDKRKRTDYKDVGEKTLIMMIMTIIVIIIWWWCW